VSDVCVKCIERSSNEQSLQRYVECLDPSIQFCPLCGRDAARARSVNRARQGIVQLPPDRSASWTHASPLIQSNRQLESHPPHPPNQTASWSHTHPSHPIKPPPGLTLSHPTQSNRQLDSHLALPPNQTTSLTHCEPSRSIRLHALSSCSSERPPAPSAQRVYGPAARPRLGRHHRPRPRLRLHLCPRPGRAG